MTDQPERIRAAAAQIIAAGRSSTRAGRDPVNLPMIRNWIEAIGDDNPVFTDPGFAASSVHGGLVAPPAMAQVWTMPGLHGTRPAGDPLGQATGLLDAAGFTSVVATNSDQVYSRYLRHGEQVSVTSSLTDVTGPKQTALGEGWFVTSRSTWTVDGETVATMDFRILKFRPATAESVPPPAALPVLRPPASPDTEFFWAGAAAGELRIQQCGECGELRHPPGPMCPRCGGSDPGYIVAAGTGEIFSYVIHHHPPLPGKQLPVIVALIQLPEGPRITGELLGTTRENVRIGLPVRVSFERVDDTLTLPAWRPRTAGQSLGAVPAAQMRPASPEASGGRASRYGGEPAASSGGDPSSGILALPELVIEVTPTFVIAAALATRDFQDVHHDRERARARGGKDIFLNILTSTGLVQRFVTAWAGPHAVFRSISVRLGTPCYAGDTLTLTGQVAGREHGRCMVSVTGRSGRGVHLTGTVSVDLPAGSS
jgi:uncharacterized OB-fold protein/acyl dehydratase